MIENSQTAAAREWFRFPGAHLLTHVSQDLVTGAARRKIPIQLGIPRGHIPLGHPRRQFGLLILGEALDGFLYLGKSHTINFSPKISVILSLFRSPAPAGKSRRISLRYTFWSTQ